MRSEYDLVERFVPGSLRGYRLWKIVDVNKIAAMTNGAVWNVNKNEAICSKSLGPFDPKCSCGFYAKYSPDDLNELITPRNLNLVAGSIKGTGKIAQGTGGFRAEFAEIEAICPLLTIDFPVAHTTYQTVVRDIAYNYGVPYFKDMEDLGRNFPPETHPLPPEIEQEIEEAAKRLEQAKEELADLSKPITFVDNNPGFIYNVNGGNIPINTFSYTAIMPPKIYLNLNGA